MHDIGEEKIQYNIALFYFQNVKKTVLSTPATPTKHKIFQSPKVVKGILVRKMIYSVHCKYTGQGRAKLLTLHFFLR